MIIKSDNFNVDKNGNMTCKNATITGGNIHIKATPYALGAIFSVEATDGSGCVKMDSYEINIDDELTINNDNYMEQFRIAPKLSIDSNNLKVNFNIEQSFKEYNNGK